MPVMTLHRVPNPDKFRTSALLAAVLVITGAGCKGTSDSALTTKIQGTLAADSAISGQPVQVAVQDGVVTLTGSVSNDAQRVLAARDAAGVQGVKKVVDSITVSQASAAAEPPPAPAPAPVAPVPVAPAPALPTQGKPLPVTKPTPQIPAPVPQHQPAPIERPQQAYNPPLPQPQPVPPPAQNPAPTAPPQPTYRNVTIASGTTIPVRITQTLDSASTQPDTTFSGVVASDIQVDGVVVIPQGTNISGHVDAVQDAAHFKGSSMLTVSLTGINPRGEHLSVVSEPYTLTGKGRGTNTAEKAGGGAAVGAILGGILGGGKGAAIGAAAGGGLGAGSQAVTRGQQVQIQSESIVRFHLSLPLVVKVRTDGGERKSDPDGLEKRSNQ